VAQLPQIAQNIGSILWTYTQTSVTQLPQIAQNIGSILWTYTQISVTHQVFGTATTYAFVSTKSHSLTVSDTTQQALSTWTANTLENTFILDSGCTRHMCHKEEFFESIEPLHSKEIDTVSGIGGHSLKLVGKGTIILPIKTIDRKEGWLRLRNVIYCPSLRTNLLLCRRLIQTGINIDLTYNYAHVHVPRAKPVTFTALIFQDLFCLDVSLPLLKARINRPGHNNKTYTSFK
jgi:hypothetical protein